MKMKISHKFRKFLAFSEFSRTFSQNIETVCHFLNISAKFRNNSKTNQFIFDNLFFFSRASDERSYQKTGKGRAVWVRRTRKAISRKCKMLSSYSTYPTQWQKKKNTKKTNQPWSLPDRPRVLVCKCCRLLSLWIVDIDCRSHSLTYSRTRAPSHSRPAVLSHTHTLTPAHALTLSLSHTGKISSIFRRKIAKFIEKREWNEISFFSFRQKCWRFFVEILRSERCRSMKIL